MIENAIKKEKKSTIKATAKFLFDVPSWIGTNNIQQSTNWLTQLIQRTFRVRRHSLNAKQETFSDAMQRLNVSPAELPARAKRFLLMSFLFLLLSIGSLSYMSYLWSNASWLVIAASFVVFCLFAVRAFFYSFWCCQIKKQRLDCSFKEWLFWLFKGGL